MTKTLLNGVTFNVVETYPKGKKLKTKLISIIKSGGVRKKIMLGYDLEGKKIYVSNKTYTKEAINKTYQALNEMILENMKKD